ncbi:hypothetical protein SDC9_44685 [bioreactor metagenome]|uniref:Uncharacterized protein n=1 Tax=bioreactor metagenome TaxID=1076179 RepID=A0A644W4V2_9ZZZZ
MLGERLLPVQKHLILIAADIGAFLIVLIEHQIPRTQAKGSQVRCQKNRDRREASHTQKITFQCIQMLGLHGQRVGMLVCDQIALA